MVQSEVDIPFIDSRIESCGPTRLRVFNRKKLKALKDKILVVQDGTTPVAVLIGYELYLKMQRLAVR